MNSTKYRALPKGFVIGSPAKWVFSYSLSPRNWFKEDGKPFDGSVIEGTICGLAHVLYGKEIYEKDILKYGDVCNNRWLKHKIKTIGIVNWIDLKEAWHPQDLEENEAGGNSIAYWNYMASTEVIGNYFENPEIIIEYCTKRIK